MNHVRSVAAVLGAALLTFGGPVRAATSSPAPEAPLVYPPAPSTPVTDTYFGLKVTDPYRNLEDGTAPATRAWAAAETKLATSYLAAQPSYAVYASRVAELGRTSTERYALRLRGGCGFYLRTTPPQAQPDLIRRCGLSGPEHVLFDAAAHAENGVVPSIESWYPAPDGSKVAFTTQLGGSENETLHVVDAETGTILPDTVPHVGGGTSPTALAWDRDGRGFYRTGFSRGADGTYAKDGILVYHHALGTDAASDPYVFGKDQPKNAEYEFFSSTTADAVALAVTAGDGVHDSIYVRDGSGPFTQVATPGDVIGSSGDTPAAFLGSTFAVVSQKRDSRGEVVAIAPGRTFATGTTLVPASALVIEGIVARGGGGFFTSDVDGGDGAVRQFDASGALVRPVPIPPVSTVTVLATDPRAAGPVIVGYEGYTSPDKWLLYDPATGAIRPTGIETRSPADFSGVVVQRVFVPSLDGKVKIPLEIVRAKSTPLDGGAMTIMTAYGAYGIISRPFFNGSALAWLERGGILAQAMIRGGGEYGEAWHEGAVHATKTNGSDDLRACAQWLAANDYSSAAHTGIEGGSAGGFLMGLALTRDPSLYGAVDAQVGIYDTLRFETTPNGAFNIPEMGTVKDPHDFAWMYAQSPYLHVVKGRRYPAILMTTGENDPRVDPFMSRKMIALLQADAAAGKPILLIQSADRGHGIGDSFDQRVQEESQSFTFFESQLR